ncbi:MAG: hypothetical protein NC319_01450 [Butyricicoccus sp.]|nr:hypothetical protein [Butyricicoccus sp.]
MATQGTKRGKSRILAVDDAAIILLRITDAWGKDYDIVTVNSGGVRGYILKPFTPDDLLERIKRVFEPEKYNMEDF